MSTHGYRHHPHYQRWYNMNKRCYNETNLRFADYGGRGITVCPEWRKQAGPKAFCDWIDANLGACPKGMSFDREDNDGNYEPGNVRWATGKEQRNNRRPQRKNSDLPVGVVRKGNRYNARVRVNGRYIHLGTYDTPEEASEVFLHARDEHAGDLLVLPPMSGPIGAVLINSY